LAEELVALLPPEAPALLWPPLDWPPLPPRLDPLLLVLPVVPPPALLLDEERPPEPPLLLGLVVAGRSVFTAASWRKTVSPLQDAPTMTRLAAEIVTSKSAADRLSMASPLIGYGNESTGFCGHS
jgi:hypothetical protein